MMLICIIPLVLTWSNGQEFVKDISVQATILKDAGSQIKVELNNKELKTKGAVSGHKLNNLVRWMDRRDCYRIPETANY